MPENTLITYEPRKILDLAEKEGKIAPADLKQFGYNSTDALWILMRLHTIGYLEMGGHKTVRPAAYFETDDGKLKKVSYIRTQSVFKLTAKGRNEKPSAGEKYCIENASLDVTGLDKILGNSGTGGIENLDVVLAGLRDKRGRTAQQAMENELYQNDMHALRENVKQRSRFAANKLFGRRMKEETPTQK
jgi:uncharacterized protein YkuJ